MFYFKSISLSRQIIFWRQPGKKAGADPILFLTEFQNKLHKTENFLCRVGLLYAFAKLFSSGAVHFRISPKSSDFVR